MTHLPPALGFLLAASCVVACSSASSPSGNPSSGSASATSGSASAGSGSAAGGTTGSSTGGSGASTGSTGSSTGTTGTSTGTGSTGSSGTSGTNTSGSTSGAQSSGSTAGGTTIHDAGSDAAHDATAADAETAPDASTHASDAGPAHTGTWRITPLGDSITGDTCGPQLLSQELIANGHTDFTFVGTVTNNQSCSGAPNVESEGHGGYLVTDLLPPPHVAVMQDHSSELPMWASNDKPDVILMQFGTNDVWNSVATQTILSAYSLVLADFRAVSPNVILFVAQITPLNPSGCANCEQQAEALNAAIPAWAAGQSTAVSPVYVVNVWSAFTASTYLPNSMYTADGVHPNPAGSALVAQKWYDALLAQNIP